MHYPMCFEIASLCCNPMLHATIRGAGTKGASIYDDTVEGGNAPLAVVSPSNALMRIGKYSPVRQLRGDAHLSPPTQHPLPSGNDASSYIESDAPPFSSIVIASISAMLGCQHPFLQSTRLEPGLLVAESLMVLGVRGPNELPYLQPVIENIQTRKVTVDLQSFYAGTRTVIPEQFLSNLVRISSVDLTPFRRASDITKGFLEGCARLEELDLRPMERATSVGPLFLSRCYSLKDLDLTPLRNITVVPAAFMCECKSIKMIDLSPLVNLTSVESYFMSSCTKLRRVILGDAFRNITTIKSHFLSNCISLSSVDLTPLSGARGVDWSFLEGCTSVRHLDLMPLQHLTCIGRSFLASCTSLFEIDLSPIGNAISDTTLNLLYGCTGLTSVRVALGPSVTTIPGSFIRGCSGLKNLSISSAAPITHIRGHFLEGSSSLADIDLGAFAASVVDVGEGFLKNCSSLERLNLEPLSSILQIHTGFVSGCTSLRTIDLRPLGQVQFPIAFGTLHGCSNLERIIISPGDSRQPARLWREYFEDVRTPAALAKAAAVCTDERLQ